MFDFLTFNFESDALALRKMILSLVLDKAPNLLTILLLGIRPCYVLLLLVNEEQTYFLPTVRQCTYRRNWHSSITRDH
jgi:hypothetical protein